MMKQASSIAMLRPNVHLTIFFLLLKITSLLFIYLLYVYILFYDILLIILLNIFTF